VLSNTDKEDASEMVARFFADFLMDNIHLVRQLEGSFMAGNGGGPLELWFELEQKAQSSV
jgi:hypothetical protein